MTGLVLYEGAFLLIRLMLAVTFALSATFKLAHPIEFWSALRYTFAEAGPTFRHALGGAVIGLELLVALGLSIPRLSRASARVALVLIVGFTAAILSSPRSGACGYTWDIAPLAPKTLPGLLTRNLLLAILAAFVAFWSPWSRLGQSPTGSHFGTSPASSSTRERSG